MLGRDVRREHRDLDVVVPRSSSKALLRTFSRLGYEENRRVRLASAGALLQVYRPCRHTSPRGPLHADDRVDVYLDAFRLHHTIALRRRLLRETCTVPPSDVLLAKLLRTRMTMTDVGDVAALLRDVDIEEDEVRGAIGLRYLARAGARDWGLYHDVTGNLARVAAKAGELGLGEREAERVESAAARVPRRDDRGAQGPALAVAGADRRAAALVRRRGRNDGQRIGLRERPAESGGQAARSGRAA